MLKHKTRKRAIVSERSLLRAICSCTNGDCGLCSVCAVEGEVPLPFSVIGSCVSEGVSIHEVTYGWTAPLGFAKTEKTLAVSGGHARQWPYRVAGPLESHTHADACP